MQHARQLYVIQNMPLQVFGLIYIFCYLFVMLVISYKYEQTKNVLNRLSAWGMFLVRSYNFV